MATTTNGNRTPEQVTREIEQERDQLATAVAELRGELSVKRLLRTYAPQIALVGTAVIGFGVAKAMLRHRARLRAVEEVVGRERFSFGRFTLFERD
jgi:Protein of unknown function (DUF3618)